jgi:hypothetical protein
MRQSDGVVRRPKLCAGRQAGFLRRTSGSGQGAQRKVQLEEENAPAMTADMCLFAGMRLLQI